MTCDDWEDVTSYRRGEWREKTAPRSLRISAGSVTITVTRHIHHPPDVWTLRCQESGHDIVVLENKDLDAALAEALETVAGSLEEMARDVRKMQ